MLIFAIYKIIYNLNPSNYPNLAERMIDLSVTQKFYTPETATPRKFHPMQLRKIFLYKTNLTLPWVRMPDQRFLN